MSVSPLLDFFKRGEVAREVRLLAAEGALAPRAAEQLAILVLLHDDADAEVRTTARATLDRIPEAALKSFLARSEVSVGLREFFADRGVFPDEMPALAADEPLVPLAAVPDADPDNGAAEAADAGLDPEAATDDESRDSLVQQIAKMSFTDRLKAALKGSREMRAILIRDPNKMVAASVLSSSKVTESEVESFARMTNVSEEVLRTIGSNRAWTKNYGVVFGLARNPKTPVALSLNLLQRLNDKDITILSTDRNVPDPVRVAARRKVSQGHQHR